MGGWGIRLFFFSLFLSHNHKTFRNPRGVALSCIDQHRWYVRCIDHKK
jgi:hypothetical protein